MKFNSKKALSLNNDLVIVYSGPTLAPPSLVFAVPAQTFLPSRTFSATRAALTPYGEPNATLPFGACARP
jgi:hypothetical protein